MPPPDPPSAPDAAPAIPDAAPTLDATQPPIECILEHRFSLGGPLDPPGAMAGPAGRVVYNQYGGVGVDDGFVDTGETFTVTWQEPTFLVSYSVNWMEDGPDPDQLWGEHIYEVETADGFVVTSTADPYESSHGVLVPNTHELRLVPVQGDRMAVARVRWCVPIPECRCDQIAPALP